MKILISADMEGATGVTCPADVLPGGSNEIEAQCGLTESYSSDIIQGALIAK